MPLHFLNNAIVNDWNKRWMSSLSVFRSVNSSIHEFSFASLVFNKEKFHRLHFYKFVVHCDMKLESSDCSAVERKDLSCKFHFSNKSWFWKLLKIQNIQCICRIYIVHLNTMNLQCQRQLFSLKLCLKLCGFYSENSRKYRKPTSLDQHSTHSTSEFSIQQ